MKLVFVLLTSTLCPALQRCGLQAFAGGRRLLQSEDSTRIAMTIAAMYSGTGVGSEAVYADVEAAGCNIPELCSRLNETSLKRGWLGAGSVKGGELELSMEGNETSAVIQAVYKENGTAVDMPTFIAGPKDFNGLSCTYSRNGLARLFTCATSTAVRKLPFTAVSPNPVKPQEPLTATLNTPYLSKYTTGSTRLTQLLGQASCALCDDLGLLWMPVKGVWEHGNALRSANYSYYSY